MNSALNTEPTKKGTPGSGSQRRAQDYEFPRAPGRVEREARLDLMARYPGVEFVGDCSKIQIEPSVRIDARAKIFQQGLGKIVIQGDVHIHANATIMLAPSKAPPASSSELRAYESGRSDNEAILRIRDTVVGELATVCGPSVSVVGSRIAKHGKVYRDGAGTISILDSSINGHVICRGHDDRITIMHSEISNSVTTESSCGAHIGIGGSSVRGVVLACASGSIEVRVCTVEGSGVLHAEHGDIDARNYTVTKHVSPVSGEIVRLGQD